MRITPPSEFENATAASCTAVRLKPLLRSTNSLSDGKASLNSVKDMNSGSGAGFEGWNGGYAIVLFSL
jgi:hypothetical protein